VKINVEKGSGVQQKHPEVPGLSQFPWKSERSVGPFPMKYQPCVEIGGIPEQLSDTPVAVKNNVRRDTKIMQRHRANEMKGGSRVM